MFVYTMKASGVKFFVIIALSVVVLTSAISILPAVSAASDVASVNTDFKNIANEEDMVKFLSNFGHEVEPKATNIYEIEIPEEFNSVFEKYNDIQRAQGLNLKRYIGKDATAYVFKVINYDFEGEVLATLFIRNGRVIAGDICSTEGDGFVHGFRIP
ncbi:MAG: DUF4830 domain-containing protein [Clostridia bacterium]|nr:DUF4830 domain-containing protein [Clostridia bacterium]